MNKNILSDKTINQWIDQNKSAFLNDIKMLVDIKSVKGSVEGKYIFGKGVGDALECALQISEREGFEVLNDNYYYGLVKYPGRKESKLGIFAHLDVVPEGNGWKFEPYNMIEKDGYLIGRGVGDNKGPAVAALYAMKYLKDNHMVLNNSIELYLGCSEEKGMDDIEYYLQKNKIPQFSFTPDVSFPICYAEKGILELKIQRTLAKDGIIEYMKGGIAGNSVASEAEAVLENLSADTINYLEHCSNISIQEKNKKIFVKAKGIAKHAAFPEGSRNAIHVLCKALSRVEELNSEEKYLCILISSFLEDYYGESIGIPYKDSVTGKLTHTCGIVEMKDGTCEMDFNIRYPVNVPRDEMKSKLSGLFKREGFVITKYNDNPPMFCDPNSEEIKLLLSICNQVLDKDLKLYTMGGGTYARKIPNTVGYGPGRNDVSAKWGNGHEADECIYIKNLEDAIKIYIRALIGLDQIVK